MYKKKGSKKFSFQPEIRNLQFLLRTSSFGKKTIKLSALAIDRFGVTNEADDLRDWKRSVVEATRGCKTHNSHVACSESIKN